MPTAPAVTMHDLELEHAELLPGRETLRTFSTQSSSKQVAIPSGNNVALVNGGSQQACTTAVGNNISQ